MIQNEQTCKSQFHSNTDENHEVTNQMKLQIEQIPLTNVYLVEHWLAGMLLRNSGIIPDYMMISPQRQGSVWLVHLAGKSALSLASLQKQNFYIWVIGQTVSQDTSSWPTTNYTNILTYIQCHCPRLSNFSPIQLHTLPSAHLREIAISMISKLQ